jgi:hypothetical protein
VHVQLNEDITTGLSEESVGMACYAYLDIDLLLNIVFLACHYVGCDWILLADIHRYSFICNISSPFRWHREDRFKVNARHIYDIKLAVKPTADKVYTNRQNRWIGLGHYRMSGVRHF